MLSPIFRVNSVEQGMVTILSRPACHAPISASRSRRSGWSSSLRGTHVDAVASARRSQVRCRSPANAPSPTRSRQRGPVMRWSRSSRSVEPSALDGRSFHPRSSWLTPTCATAARQASGQASSHRSRSSASTAKLGAVEGVSDSRGGRSSPRGASSYASRTQSNSSKGRGCSSTVMSISDGHGVSGICTLDLMGSSSVAAIFAFIGGRCNGDQLNDPPKTIVFGTTDRGIADERDTPKMHPPKTPAETGSRRNLCGTFSARSQLSARTPRAR